jgi:hypothetical protein
MTPASASFGRDRPSGRVLRSYAVVLNYKLCSGLTLYSPLAAALGWLVHSWVPWMTQKTFYASLVGGGLCLVWAVLAWLGHRIRAGTVLTLMVMGFLFLADTVQMWQERGLTKISVVLTGLTVLTVLLLTALVHDFGGPHPDEKSPGGLPH